MIDFSKKKGYLGLPEPTAEKFIQNPFSEDPQNRFYRTGDLGRYLPNGQVECIGRADDQVNFLCFLLFDFLFFLSFLSHFSLQVKIRGFRIELREIDTYLGQHSQIRECVTIVRRDANEEKILVSYFVAREAGGVDLADVRSFLKTKLANYSIPSIFFQLTKMPLTPNGKVWIVFLFFLSFLSFLFDSTLIFSLPYSSFPRNRLIRGSCPLLTWWIHHLQRWQPEAPQKP